MNETKYDTAPSGMLVFSAREDCSDLSNEWSPFPFADGLLIVGAPAGGKQGVFGDQTYKMKPTEAALKAVHSHTLVETQVASTPGCVSFAAAGCNSFHIPCNEFYNGCGGIPAALNVNPAALTVPVIRMQLCVRA